MACHLCRCSRSLVSVLATALLAGGAARANGAFPDEFSIHFPANAPHRILMGANFGLLVSEDDGATWRYSCEPWVVSSSNAALSNENVSFYQVTANGAVIADSVTVTRSSDVACTWPTSGGAIAGQAVDDIFADANDPKFVLAIVVFSGGSYILASHDGGVTFDPTHLYDTTDILTGIETARSQQGVVYASSVARSGAGGTFLASSNFGNTWTATAIQSGAGTQPRILGVDPADANTVYLRVLSGPTDAMWITSDGGKTFNTNALPINGQFSSFLRASDGALYAGTIDGKLYVRPAGPGATFTVRSAPHLRCLGQRWGTTRIFGCGDMNLDGFSLAYSDDNGATFHPLMSFTQLLGPLACAPVQTNCQAHWDRIQGVLGIGGIAADGGSAGGGGGGTGGGGSPSGSHCASAGADAWSIWVALAFLSKRMKS